MKNKDKNFISVWDDEHKYARVVISHPGGKKYLGLAHCHPDDFDVCSRLVGETIATKRALIEALKDYQKDCKKELKALQNFYYTVNKSKKYNRNGYMEKMLYRRMMQFEYDIENIGIMIKEVQVQLKYYIEQKDN